MFFARNAENCVSQQPHTINFPLNNSAFYRQILVLSKPKQAGIANEDDDDGFKVKRTATSQPGAIDRLLEVKLTQISATRIDRLKEPNVCAKDSRLSILHAGFS